MCDKEKYMMYLFCIKYMYMDEILALHEIYPRENYTKDKVDKLK